MEYELKPSHFFLQQIDELSDDAKRVVENRLKLVKVNPFRNRRIHGFNLFLFRIRFEEQHREKRVPEKILLSAIQLRFGLLRAYNERSHMLVSIEKKLKN